MNFQNEPELSSLLRQSSSLSIQLLLHILKKRRQFFCTDLLRSNKLVHLHGKILACFT